MESRALVHEASEALQPELLILRPESSLTPNLENRQQVESFIKQLGTTKQDVTFLPTGVWPTELCVEWVTNLGLVAPVPVLGADPLDEWLELKALSSSHPSYFLLRPRSKRVRIEDIEDLHEKVLSSPSSWVSFAHDNRYPDAKRFLRELSSE